MLSPVLATYRGVTTRFDEALDAAGRVRPAWTTVATALDGLPADALGARARSADRLLLAAGATYSSTEGTTSGAWHLDPVPLVYGADEWAGLARGLEQRCRLFDAVLADLYGPRRLVTRGLVPVELVHAAGGFQPSAAGWTPRGPRLTVYAADVVRNAAGGFVVLRDHTDAPSGAGRTMLNRSVLTRVLPDAFREARVAPLTSWFAHLRRALGALAPTSTVNPRVVLMAPPIDDPDYAEQAYLATQLGYNVADANDLMVRDGRLLLRSIGGPEPVDVLLRTRPDAQSDPLEAAPAGGSGVAGLTQAAREGRLGLANSLGSSLGGILALTPFLGAACAELLGEALVLDSVEALWCGDAGIRAKVAAQIDGYVLHDASPHSPVPSVFGWNLSATERAEWLARLRSTPWRVVAQPRLDLATSPVVRAGELVAGTTVLRAFALNGPDGAHVLPGGLGRVVRADVPVMAQRSEASKDVWVLVAPGTSVRSTAAPGHRGALSQIDLRESLPSRAADALFWVGRNAERAEMVARTTLASTAALQQDPDLADADGGAWVRAAVAIVAAVSGRVDGVVPEGPHALDEAVASALADRTGGLADSLSQLQRSAVGVREFLSTGTWRVLATLGQARQRLVELGGVDRAAGAASIGSDGYDGVLDPTVTALAAFAGLVQESVVRGPSWRFLDLGRRIERAQILVAALAAGVDPARRVLAPATGPGGVGGAVGELVLACCESLGAYRRRYRSDVRPGALVDLLVADDTNPRSLAFQLDRVIDDLTSLPERAGRQRCLELATSAATAALDLSDVERAPDAFGPTLAEVRRFLVELPDAVTRCWFTGVEARRDARMLGTTR